MERKRSKTNNRTEVANKNMIPVLFEPKETKFDHFGIGAMNDCKSCIVTEEENGQYEAVLTFPITTKYSEYLEDRNYQIKCKPNDEDEYNIFTIYNHYKDMATGVLHVSAKSRTFKLGNRTVQKVVIEGKSGKQAMKLLHDGMDLESDIEMFCDIESNGSTSFEVENPLTCIKGTSGSLLQTYGGEIKHEPFKLSLLERRGHDDVTTIRFRKNLGGLKVELDWSGLITRVFPYADIQNSEGQTERIYGNQIDSQYIKNYDGEVYAKHIQFTEEQGVTDVKSLNNVSKNYFTSMNPGVDKPKVNISIDLIKLDTSDKAKKFKDFRKLCLCDTFSIFHERYEIDLSAKVIAIEYDSLSEKVTKLTAGDAKYTFFEEQKHELTEVFKKVPTKSYASVFIDYVTQIISGNDGGHVVWWPKNRPSDLFFCDNPVLEKAKQVLRINKSGIGFSSSGWKGPFDTAWTLDGTFVADFIRAGVLRAIDIIGVNITGSTIKGTDIFGSTFETVNPNGTKIRLKNGIISYFTKEDKQLVSISASDDNAGKSFNLQFQNGSTAELFYINEENITLKHSKLIQLRAPKIEMVGNVNVQQKLTINGQEVFPGQGGGGNNNGGSWNGMYPPEVTSQADKFAWELWVILLSKGYSKAAAAGILANVQGEAGVSMNPDIAQIGGPAYGIVQWDGSAYPLVGAPTYNGREYVQRLMGAAGITEDYRTMSAQGNLLDWTMYNGQWLGIVQPATQSGFKTMTDPGAAAYTFERNYERPANAHPERQGWAVNWYNKFKDLQIQSGGNILSTAKSLIGYFHYSQPMRWNFGSVENPDRNGYADCSSFVWLALTKAGYRTAPRGTLWYTGSMRDDARGARQYLTEVSPNEAKAGDIIIVNLGAGAGNDGHTAVLAEDWHGYTTAIVEMGGMQSGGVGVGRVDWSFGYLLNGGDVCLARAKK